MWEVMGGMYAVKYFNKLYVQDDEGNEDYTRLRLEVRTHVDG